MGEEFFEPELAALRGHLDVLHVPVRPTARRKSAGVLVAGLLDRVVLQAAVTRLLKQPLGVLRSTAEMVEIRRPGKSLRNLLTVPKALWLAGQLKDGDVLVAAWVTTPATVAYVAHALTGVPWATYVHRRDILEGVPLCRKTSSAAFVRAISEASAVELSKRCDTVTEIVHLGIDLPGGPNPLGREVRDLRVLCIASLIPLKNHDTILRALATPTAATVHLTLAGDGPERSRLQTLAEALGVADRVQLLGHVEHDQLLDRLDRGEWDLVTLASTTEGIPVSLIEALGRGIPVVSSDVGGVAELVRPVGALVADPMDASGFAQAWMETAGAWAPASAERARRFVRDEFSATASAQRIRDLVHEAVRYSPSTPSA